MLFYFVVFAEFQVKIFSLNSGVVDLATADGLINGSITNDGFATEFTPVIDYNDGFGDGGSVELSAINFPVDNSY